MIEFMDGIVEAVEEFARTVAEGMIFFLGVLAKFVIIITAPAWILPYKAIRAALERRANYSYAKKVAKMGEYVGEGFRAGLESVEKPRCESPDCERCPFPPCREREGGND